MIGELCAYHVGVFLRLLNQARWCSSENAIKKNMQTIGLNKIHTYCRMDILTQLTCRIDLIAINNKLSVILN